MNPNHPLIQTVQKLIDAGCHYRLDELAQYYTPDLHIIIVQPNGKTAQFDYEQNMAFFRQRLKAGLTALNTSARFDYVGEQGDTGYVITTRNLDLGAGEQTIVFSLMLRQEAGRWRVFREHAIVTA
ncbi:nuclear transport factor 2 family protein [Neisseria sp. 83E34]|uniref:nuclear transport factor 2 family protein n=1 Tax=Neisseria sp. 83E34 TaxID=1692264 RepID=UPI0006CE8BC2|nr:nuclear transport factor 2 family protein [Neisseria sp. 83E34]KPN71850.1 hypothetical protein AKG09_03845 [Neisseria sp. 83E34]